MEKQCHHKSYHLSVQWALSGTGRLESLNALRHRTHSAEGPGYFEGAIKHAYISFKNKRGK